MKMTPFIIADATTTAPAAATTTTVATEGTPVADGQTAPQSTGGFMSFLPIVLLIGVFYFMMIRPQQRKEKERQKMISELQAGAKISFAGGLLGTIKSVEDDVFVVEICPGTTIEVARGAVAGVVTPPADATANK